MVTRAEEVLRALEEGREGHKPLARIDDLPLFGASAPVVKWKMPKASSAVEEIALKISRMDFEPCQDALSPKAGAGSPLVSIKAEVRNYRCIISVWEIGDPVGP